MANAKFIASLNQLFRTPGVHIIGVDEVARGCLAGPVVACAVCLNPERVHAELPGLALKIDDSKKLKPSQRAAAETWIKSVSLSWAIGSASVEEIAALNIREATFLAMNRALSQVLATLPPAQPAEVTIDGNAFKVMPGFTFPPEIDVKTLIKGDATHLGIACASIIAKETRDRMLDDLVRENPGLAVYNWEKNRAYGTPDHFKRLRDHGPCNHHRLGFLKKLGPG